MPAGIPHFDTNAHSGRVVEVVVVTVDVVVLLVVVLGTTGDAITCSTAGAVGTSPVTAKRRCAKRSNASARGKSFSPTSKKLVGVDEPVANT